MILLHLRQQSYRHRIRPADTQLMVGPRPAGPPWTLDGERELLAMMKARLDKAIIARKLKRTVAAIISHRGKLRQLERQSDRQAANTLPTGDQRR